MRRTKEKTARGELYVAYGLLAEKALRNAVHIALYDADGARRWASDTARKVEAGDAALVTSLRTATHPEPLTRRLSEQLTAALSPVAVNGKLAAVLLAHIAGEQAPEHEVLNELLRSTAPLLDTLSRELNHSELNPNFSATLAERTEELEWLFSLSENLHSNSNDSKTVAQLMGATVERMKCCFGAVIVPEHGVDCSHLSLVHMDIQAQGAFDRCRPYFLSLMQRRRAPFLANKVSSGTNLPAFKWLLVPIAPHDRKLLGFVAFFKQPSLANFSRRQLFLARHIAHQIGSLLESQYDLATGLLTRKAFEHDVRHFLQNDKSGTHALMYFNVDRMRLINDTLGFEAGDVAIVRTGDLLRPPLLPENAVTCRLAGDVFLTCLPGCDEQQALSRAQAIIAACGRYHVGPSDGRVKLGLSCGVTMFRHLDEGLDHYLNQGEAACRSVKQSGGNRAATYIPPTLDDTHKLLLKSEQLLGGKTRPARAPGGHKNRFS